MLFLKVSGSWKVIYSTITVLGSKRTKLGLRDFISLDDCLQIIDVAEVLIVTSFRKFMIWYFPYFMIHVLAPLN